MGRVRVLVPLVMLALGGCAAAAIFDWQNQTLQSKADRDAAFSASVRALSEVGSVKFSDKQAGVVTGPCGFQVEASILVTPDGQGSTVALKARLVQLDSAQMVFDVGQRDTCLNALAASLRKSGV